jgi:hypothetical protein
VLKARARAGDYFELAREVEVCEKPTSVIVAVSRAGGGLALGVAAHGSAVL